MTMTRDEKLIAFTREEFAGLFDMYASDQHAMISRYKTKKEKREADIRAECYAACANDLRNPKIVINAHDMKG